jgi:hypothetical protein
MSTGSGAVTYSLNTGQRPFAYTAPSGFKALNTQNLPTPAIGATSTTLANKQFDATLYTGTGSALTVTNAGAFKPDLVWYKDRSAASSNALFDAIRGVDKWLTSNGTDAEATISGVSAFNSNGFSLGTNAGGNFSGRSYVAWQWKGGNGTVSNTAGTITSTVSANTTAGISIVNYVGTGANATVGHGLGAAPKLIIVKARSSVVAWPVYHASIGNGNFLLLNATDASSATTTAWNSTTPTSTVFSIGASSGTNISSTSHIAYCFAEVAGFSKFGSYTGNGSADGPFVFLGLRARWILVKRTDVARDWVLIDTARAPYNLVEPQLFPNSSAAEDTTVDPADILSNGFKLRTTDASWNASGGTYVYAAFAEAPFNFSRAR